MAKGISLALLPYIDKEANKVTYPWLKDRKDPTKFREYPLIPEEEIRFLLVKKLILEYGYSPEQTDLEVEIKSGQTTLPKRADIVVFRNGRSKDAESNAYIICEVKRKDRKDGLDQLETYMNNTTAEFGIWWNGKDIVHLHRLKEPHKFEEIPDIPRKGETLEDVGTWGKEKLVIATDLIKVFDTIHNHIYANEGLLKEKVFNEMLKFIFMKMVDEKLPEPKPYFRITAKELEAVREGKGESFKERIETVWTRVRKEYGDVFDEDERINLQLTSQAFVVSQFQRFDFRRTPADIKGTAFQTFVYAHQRGERGEFFTPHPVAEVMVKMLYLSDPEAVLDPACGSGGLLVRAMLHAWEKIGKATHLNELEKRERKYTYARYYIRGIDFNPDLARVSKMHMVVYDDGHTGCFCANSLEEFETIKRTAVDFGAIRVTETLREGFDVVLTNPPFGTKGKVTDKRILQQFDLGFKWVKDKKTGRWYKTDKIRDGQTPEILFIERCMQFLKPHGRMAIVLPDGILSNSTLEYVRQWIMANARVLASVSLPPETFVPYGSGAKASVLFLQKLPPDEVAKLKEEGYDTFFASVKKVGYDVRGREIHKRDEKGELVLGEDKEPIVDTDIPRVIKAFKVFRRERNFKFRPEEELGNPGFLTTEGATFSVVPYGETSTSRRLDAAFYDPIALTVNDKVNRLPHSVLGNISKVVCGPFGSEIHEVDYRVSGIPLIRIGDLKDVFVGEEGLVFIEQELSLRLQKTSVYPSDIVVSQRGTIGLFSYVTPTFNKWNISANLIAIKDIKTLNKEFCLIFLNSKYGQAQIKRFISGQVQPKITTDDIKALKISIPPQDLQSHVSSLVRHAYVSLKDADEKYKEADDLLYKALAIGEAELSPDQTYLASSKEVEESGMLRFDVDFYQPMYKRIRIRLEKASFPVVSIKEICGHISNKVNPEEEPYRTKITKYLEIGDIDVNTGEIKEWTEAMGWQLPKGGKYPLAEGYLVYSKVRPYRKGIAVIPESLESGLATQGFVVLSPKDIEPEYLFIFLRSDIGNIPISQKLKGSTYPTVEDEDVLNLQIPLLDHSSRSCISELIKESFTLRKESRQLIDQAKREVEEYIEKEAENISTSGAEFVKG